MKVAARAVRQRHNPAGTHRPKKGVALAERTRRFILWFLPAAAAAALSLAATPARAQFEQLPPSDRTSYGADAQEQIRQYVSARLQQLGSEDVATRERARKQLLEPLSRPTVSVAFRRTYREAAIETLTSLAAGGDEAVTINALLALGELADDPSRQVVQEYTDAESVAVRYAAVVALTRTLRAIDFAAPAIDPTRVTSLVSHLRERLETEPDPSVADAVARALLTAASIQRDGFAAPAQRALVAVGGGVGSRVRAAEESDRALALMTAVRVAQNLAGRLAAPGDVSPEVCRAASAFAGEILAHLAARANQGELSNSGGWETDLVTLSERILVFAHSKLGSRLAAPGLPDLLQSGNQRAFYDRVRTLVLGLSGGPCNLTDESMQRIREALEGR